MPDFESTRHDQNHERDAERHDAHLGDNQDEPPIEAVHEDPGDQPESNGRDGPRENDQPEMNGGSGQVEDEQRTSGLFQPERRGVGDLAEPEEREVGVPERCEDSAPGFRTTGAPAAHFRRLIGLWPLLSLGHFGELGGRRERGVG